MEKLERKKNDQIDILGLKQSIFLTPRLLAVLYLFLKPQIRKYLKLHIFLPGFMKTGPYGFGQWIHWWVGTSYMIIIMMPGN